MRLDVTTSWYKLFISVSALSKPHQFYALGAMCVTQPHWQEGCTTFFEGH
jgi:hypothetical protein